MKITFNHFLKYSSRKENKSCKAKSSQPDNKISIKVKIQTKKYITFTNLYTSQHQQLEPFYYINAIQYQTTNSLNQFFMKK
jgi:hypothetical protein